MSSAVLAVDNLGKAFRRFASESHRVLSLLGMPIAPLDEHWALRNVSFSLVAGESVGIVGRNGAGKSTLLKLVTGTLRPSEGTLAFGGRVAAILELGMGFNGDLTGRQNALHSAGLMGLPRAEIARLMPEVEEFAEVGPYFDEPVRTYSTGMQMRVAFAVATAVRPDLLIIDEALSVGDAYFQHKSFDRIRRFAREGTSLLIVSHDKTAVQALCSRAILLDRGRVLGDGDPADIMDLYNALIAEKERSTVRLRRLDDGAIQTISGTGETEIVELRLVDDSGAALESFPVGAGVRLVARALARQDVDTLVFGFLLKDRIGQSIYGTNTWHRDAVVRGVRRGESLEFEARWRMDLGPGSYSISVALTGSDTHLAENFEWRDRACVFAVHATGPVTFDGVCDLDAQMTVERGKKPQSGA